jgi:hypothetical protein
MKLKDMIVGLCIFLLSSSVNAIDVKTYIPPQAYSYRLTIKDELNTYFRDIPHWNYIPSLIEHESCISLTHSRCWNPKSRLKTSREEGAGLGQLTRAYNSDGTLRFDSLAEMRRKYYNELKELKWETIYSRPDLQIRTMILMVRDNYNMLYAVEDEDNRLQMSDAAYNGGLSGLLKERRACGLASNCDPNIWFDNVEKHCLKSTKVLYGSRSACDINRHHVYDVYIIRMPKYQMNYFNEAFFKVYNVEGVNP